MGKFISAGLALLMLAALVTGCSPARRGGGHKDSANNGADAGDVTQDAGGQDTGPDVGVDPAQEPSDLGQLCAGGCNLSTCVLDSEDCEGGVCVWDGPRASAYCSRPCVSSCVPGYSCRQTDDGSGPVCLSDTPMCGNSRVEFGEACDDGNHEGSDLCSPNCAEVTDPPSGGTLNASFHGEPPLEASGLEPTVFAHRIAGRLYFGASNTEVSYGMSLPDEAGPAPYTVLLEAGLAEAVGTNLCVYSGATSANITRLDFEAKEVAGNAAWVMFCTGGNCEFGCNPEFTLAIDFDLRWVDKEQ